uniref:Uncharacterized protein n=1 Tax=Electrophorus electricus TaxID=8005 RepID=A0A4W4EHJ9_ELEEL
TSYANHLSEKQFQCSICLNVFTDPVSTPCGHNFCKSCLTDYWDNSLHFHCPLCKEKFTKRPELKINTTLREVVDQFKKKKSFHKPDVLCDTCTGVKSKAVKSCLDCGLTFCKSHLEPHNNVPKLKKHKVINPVKNLENYICQKHERPLELFCRNDKMCVCQFCIETDHKTHRTVPVENESGQKKTQLWKTQSEVQQMIQERLKKIEEIKHSVELRKVEKEIADNSEVFNALIRAIERSQAELHQVMEEKQKAVERQAEGLIKDLEQEITDLKRRDTELEQLSHTEDHIHLLQVSIETGEKPLHLTFSKHNLLLSVDVTLDPDTANRYLILSDDGKKVTCGDTKQNLPDNPKRFDMYAIVLGKEGFSSGRFYYEVQVKGKTEWDVGVARESVNRKGQITLTPQNGYWTVCLRNGNEYKACADFSILLSLREKPNILGVFVDYEEGLVSFYDVEARSHIYSFTGQQSFTEKLYPYVSPFNSVEGKNSAPLIISSVLSNLIFLTDV